MRLRPADYRHPAELPALIAGLWLAATLLLAAHAVAVVLIVAPPLGAWPWRVIGVLLLGLLDTGLVLGLMRLPGHIAQVRSSARPVGPTNYERIHQAAELAAQRLHLPATPPVLLLTEARATSFTLAWERPEIYLTEGLADALDDLELRAALAHEMARIRDRRMQLVTAVAEPLRARLVHPLLRGGFALAWLALRRWDRAAQLSADRAAAIAVGGAEPVAAWLTEAIEQSPEALEADLRHYLTFGADRFDRAFAEAELRLTHPTVAPRIIELARFLRSQRFANCQAIIGDLRLEVQPRVADPALPGVASFAILGLLAGVWLAPVTVAITLALGAPQPEPVVAPISPAPPTVTFDPNAPQTLAPTRPPDASPFQPAAPTPGSPADLAGLLEVARIHKDHGDLGNARRTLEEVLLRDPTMVEAHYILAWVHAQAGDKDLAADEFRAVLNLADPSSQRYQEAAQALERLGY